MVKNKNYLSIKEMGKLRGVSSQTLRFYDRIGIFKPDYVDPETGYRYYDPEQYEKLGTILELRQLNFSLDEIKEYFTERNMHKSANMLAKHYAELKEEISFKQRLADKIGEKLEFIEKVNSGEFCENTCIIKEYPDRYAIVQPFENSDDISIQLMHLEKELNETAPILASDRIGFHIDFCTPDMMLDLNNWKAMIFCTEEMSASADFMKLPAGKYICMYFRDYTVDRSYYMKYFLEYIKFKEIRLKGIAIQQFIIDVTITDIASETIIEIQALIDDE